MSPKCALAGTFIGAIALLLGLLLPTLFHMLVYDEMKQMLPLLNGSYSFNMWRTLPVPMLIQVYVFDVVNADEVMAGVAKPYVVEKGPYSYRLKKEKVNITYNANLTVTYRQRTWYYFDREHSVGDETDNFTTINNILLGAAYMTRFQFPFIKEMTKVLLETEGGRLYETYTVKDMLWGYEDRLLKFVKKDVLKYLHLDHFLDDRFGFFYKWNGSDQGQFTVFTGKADLNRLNQVDTFNGLSYAPWWSTRYARMLNGTDGTFFAPFLDKDKRLYFYSPNACRTMYMDFLEHNIVKDVETYRYILPNSMLESGAVDPYNVGFCTPDITHCMPSGVLNVSGCRLGSSAVMSYPHFLGGDPEVIEAVQGLAPDPVQHAAYLDLEPISGVPMEVAMRLQIAVYVSKFAGIRQLKNTKTYFHPIFWFNETTVMTDEMAGELRSELLLFVHIVGVLQYLLPCIGAALTLLSVMYLIRRHLKMKKKMQGPNQSTPLLASSDTGLVQGRDTD